MGNFDGIIEVVARCFASIAAWHRHLSLQPTETHRRTIPLPLLATVLLSFFLLPSNELMAQSHAILPAIPLDTITGPSVNGMRTSRGRAPIGAVSGSKAAAKTQIRSLMARPKAADESEGWDINYWFDNSDSGIWFYYYIGDPNPPYGDLTFPDVPPATFTFSSSTCSSIIGIVPSSEYVTEDDLDFFQAWYDDFGDPGPYSWVEIYPLVQWNYVTWVDAPTSCDITASLDGSGVVATTTIQVPAFQDPSLDPGDETDPCGSCKAGSPISLQTGNVSITQTDLKIPGLGGGLQVVRAWNSKWPNTLSAPSSGMFGPQWRSTYEERLFLNTTTSQAYPVFPTMKYSRGDGSFWTFSQNADGTYQLTAPANSGATLSAGQSHWIITFKNGERRLFANTSGSLTAIIDRNSNATYLNYDALNRLVSVTDPASRHLHFSYGSNGNLCTGITSDVGLTLTYSYDAVGRLVRVTKPDKSTVGFDYPDSSTPLISAVEDSHGVILESHTYDQYGRGLTSSRANGVEAITMTYPSTQ